MKPTELIVANAMHEIAERVAKLPRVLIDAAPSSMIEEAVARDILCQISHHGRLDLVLKAIAAAGGPPAGEIASRFKAVQDMHTQK